MSETAWENATSPSRNNSNQIETAIRRQVEKLSYLPGSAAVAVKFIEIGKDPDAGPAEYDKIISSDTALSSKLLSLANSSWFATRHQVTKVLQAVNLLGINNVRTLSISHCLTGMYNGLKIAREDVDCYWQASLCKGVAAKTFAHVFDESCEDEAFMSGLFQDMALPVIHAVAGESLLEILSDKRNDAKSGIAAERERFGVDHTEVGRLLATKLELPESYIDAIAFHHDPECLRKFCESDVIAGAVQVAGFFPHLPRQWHADDVERLTAFLAENASQHFPNRESFLDAVQQEFDMLYGFFQPGETPALRLHELISDACEELADATASMMGQMNTLMAEAAQMGSIVNDLAAKHEKLDDQSRKDPLTEVLNRVGFLGEAERTAKAAARYSHPFAILYIDVDKFKPTNDTHGHHFGDFVLREMCNRVRGQLRKVDLFGRMGGDEFVILLNDVDQGEIRGLSDAIVKAVRHGPYVKGKVAEQKTVSLGVLWVPPEFAGSDIESLISEADALMYMAKRSGPGRVRMRAFSGATTKAG